MKAIVMRELGPPSVLRIEDVPMPQIEPHEVLLKVGACGVSYHDVVERNGAYRRGVHLPQIPGYEIAGVVEEIGRNVTTLKTGDHVCCKPFHVCGLCRRCRNGMETACRKRRGVRGGYAEYVAIPEEALVSVPADMPLSVACALGPTTGVALNAVRDVAKVRINENVLVTGASGGLGLPSIELARAMGATVIAVTRSAAKRERLIEMGAHHVVVAPDGMDFSDEVKALTQGDGVEVVIDNVGSRVFTPAFRSLAIGGRACGGRGRRNRRPHRAATLNALVSHRAGELQPARPMGELVGSYGKRVTLDEAELFCSSCSKTRQQVQQLIAGPAVFIGNECVDTCNDFSRQTNSAK